MTLPTPVLNLLTDAIVVFHLLKSDSWVNAQNHHNEFYYVVAFSHLSNIRNCLDQLCCYIRKYAFLPKIYVWLTPVYIVITG